MATTQSNGRSWPSRKILANLVTTGAIATAIGIYAQVRGLELTNQEITGFVAVLAVIANSVGYKIRESNPSPSAEQTLLDQGWKRPIPTDPR